MAKLNLIDTVNPTDNFVLWVGDDQDYSGLSQTNALTFFQDNLDFSVGKSVSATQYTAPSATGFTVAVTNDGSNVHLIMTPAATYAAGTITLPGAGAAVDKQEVLVNCTQIITTLTIGANGATAVTGAPTTLAANDFFTLKYDAPTSTWYRVG